MRLWPSHMGKGGHRKVSCSLERQAQVPRYQGRGALRHVGAPARTALGTERSLSPSPISPGKLPGHQLH